MKKVKLKLNVKMLGNSAGTILELPVTDNGTIKDSFYRRRLKDSKVDNCVEIVKSVTLSKSKKSNKE